MTSTQPVGITHIWPGNKLINPNAQPFSDERETDVWDELRALSFDLEHDLKQGRITVVTHYPDGGEDFLSVLKKGEVVLSRVFFFEPREIELKVHRLATSTIRKEKISFHLGSHLDAQELIKRHRKGEVSVLVLWWPDESEHLTYLPKVQAECPDLPIYIFHCDYREDRWGVEREGGSGNWQSRFHTKTEALIIPEHVDVVVRGLCNVGSVSMWGALPKHGKSYLFLSLMKALLSGKPWLGYFEVSQSKRVVYLVPEVGLRGVMKRLRKLGMVDYLYDPIANPDGGLFLQTLSSKSKLKLDDTALLRAVQGADVFVDPIIRYIEGEENNASDQRILSNKLLALISAEARSVWCAHHSPKAFKDVTDITTQNVLRGTGEFAAFPDIIFGVLKTNDETGRLYIKCTDARDDDEYLGDFEVEMRPWIDETGDLKLIVPPGTGTPLREQRRTNSKPGPKADSERQAKVDFAKNTPGSLQDKADAINGRFGSKHSKSYVSGLLKEKEFDADNTQESF